MPYQPQKPPMFGDLLLWTRQGEVTWTAMYARREYKMMLLDPYTLKNEYGYEYGEHHWTLMQAARQSHSVFSENYPRGYPLKPDLHYSKIMAELFLVCPWWEPGMVPPIHEVIHGEQVIQPTLAGQVTLSMTGPNVVSVFRGHHLIADVSIGIRAKSLVCKPFDVGWIVTRNGRDETYSTWPEAYFSIIGHL